jgi:hypothetical protein
MYPTRKEGCLGEERKNEVAHKVDEKERYKKQKTLYVRRIT